MALSPKERKALRARWDSEPALAWFERLRCEEFRIYPKFDFSPFGTWMGKLDFRGLMFPEHMVSEWTQFECEGEVLKDCDLSLAVIEPISFSRCSLTDCVIRDAVLEQSSFTWSKIKGCEFRRVRMENSHLGFGGSQWESCTFAECAFEGFAGGTASFVRCRFEDCDYTPYTDFQAAQFEDCEFAGLMERVFFRGGHLHELDLKALGPAPPNRMLRVSFLDADLIDVTITSQCDLSTVILPRGRWCLYDEWESRLERVQQASLDSTNEAKKALASFFYMNAKLSQNWGILGLDHLEKEYGLDGAAAILSILGPPTRVSEQSA